MATNEQIQSVTNDLYDALSTGSQILDDSIAQRCSEGMRVSRDVKWQSAAMHTIVETYGQRRDLIIDNQPVIPPVEEVESLIADRRQISEVEVVIGGARVTLPKQPVAEKRPLQIPMKYFGAPTSSRRPFDELKQVERWAGRMEDICTFGMSRLIDRYFGF